MLLVGGAYGATRGFATLAAYLLVGGLGYGVFAGHGSGWDVLRFSSATGGYLVGMLVAATLVGWLADRGWDRKATRSIPAMVLGDVVILLFGATWLAHALDLTAVQAWNLGVKDFSGRRRDQDPARRGPPAGRMEARRRHPSLIARRRGPLCPIPASNRRCPRT